jgi:hypothetical protein
VLTHTCFVPFFFAPDNIPTVGEQPRENKGEKAMGDEEEKGTWQKVDVGNESDAFMDALGEIDISAEDLKGDKEGEDKGKQEEDKGKQEIDTELATAKAERDELLRKNKDLNKALHEERQSKKAAKIEPEAVLSDADLAKIIQEHKDDPAVLLNAVAYKAQQAMKGAKAEAVNEVEVKTKQTALNQMLRERYGEALDDASSPIRQAAEKASEYLGLDDHPYRDTLSVAAAVLANLPHISQAAYMRGVKDSEAGTVEKNRQSSIKNGQQFFGKGGKEEKAKAKELSETEMDTAKRLGFKPGSPQWKIYQSQIRRQKAA